MPKVVTVAELRRKTHEQRTALVAQLRQQLREQRFEQRGGSLRTVRTIRVLRRSIAKVLTIDNQPAKS